MKPRYEHDACPHCRFLGQLLTADVWYCPQPEAPRGTVMFRYSSEPPDYTSGRNVVIRQRDGLVLGLNLVEEKRPRPKQPRLADKGKPKPSSPRPGVTTRLVDPYEGKAK